MATFPRLRLLPVLAIIAMVAGLGVGWYWTKPADPWPEDLGATILAPPKPVAAFTLLDQNGQPFDQQGLKGKWSFLFFGYTHCPDVCPLTLTTFAQVRKRLETDYPDALNDARFVFVTVDPKRDTPEHLKDYVGYFHKDFIGLSGTPEQLKSFTKPLGVMYSRAPSSDPNNYLMDHSAAVILLDPHGRLFALLSPPHEVKRMVRAFVEIHKRGT